MIELAMNVRDALLIAEGLVCGVLLWQVEKRLSRVRDRDDWRQR